MSAIISDHSSLVNDCLISDLSIVVRWLQLSQIWNFAKMTAIISDYRNVGKS